MILLIISQINKIIWFEYSPITCPPCYNHKTPILKMDDSTYILGSFHYYNNKLRIMLIGIKVKTGITVEWYKAWLSSPNLDLNVSTLTKINDTLIAVGGGHECGYGYCSFFGLFNLKTQNFVWAKYLSVRGMVSSIAYDGNSLVLATQGHYFDPRGAIIKTDLNGNVIWAKRTSFGCAYNDNFSIIPEQNGYIVMGVGWGEGGVVLMGNLLYIE